MSNVPPLNDPNYQQDQPYNAPQPGQPGQPYNAPQPGQPYSEPQPGQPYQAPQPGQQYQAQPPNQPYQAPGQPYVAPNLARPSRPSWLKWVIGGIVAVILACILIFVFVFVLANNLTQPMTNAGDAFMNALKAGDYDTAYGMCTTSLQQEVGDANGLKTGLLSLQPTTWNWDSRSVTNGQGQLSGTATFSDGKSNPVSLVLQQVGNDWKVAGVNLRPQ